MQGTGKDLGTTENWLQVKEAETDIEGGHRTKYLLLPLLISLATESSARSWVSQWRQFKLRDIIGGDKMGRFKGLPGSGLFQSGWNSAYAALVAKNISRDDFLKQLHEAWLDWFSQTKGAVDKEQLLGDMRKRIKKLHYEKVFQNAGITDTDLAESFDKALAASGKKLREVGQ